MSITISEIAKLAGVSRGTVDRVIHNRDGVSPKTKEKILALIEEYDFHPNMLGRALSQNKSVKYVGLLMLEKGNPFYQLIEQGARDAMHDFEDYPIKLITKQINGIDEKEYLKALDELSKQVCAMAVFGLNTPAINRSINKIVDLGIPVLSLNIDLENTKRTGFIGIDNYKAGCCVGGLIKDILRDGDQVLLVSGKEAVNSQNDRVQGFLNIMKHFPRIHISNINYSNDEKEISAQIIRSHLLKEHYDAIVMVDSWLANAGDVAASLNQRPYIIGFDMMPQNKQALLDNKVSYIIDQGAIIQAYSAIKVLCEYVIHGESLPVGEKYLPIYIYNRYNV